MVRLAVDPSRDLLYVRTGDSANYVDGIEALVVLNGTSMQWLATLQFTPNIVEAQPILQDIWSGALTIVPASHQIYLSLNALGLRRSTIRWSSLMPLRSRPARARRTLPRRRQA